MLVNVVLRLQEYGCGPTATVSKYPTPQALRSVSASNIISIIRSECKQVGAARLRFAPEDVGMHSLGSGGAMAMHIAGVLNRTLMAIGRWRSLGFIVYIQQQISSFIRGISVRMSAQHEFRLL